MSRPYLKSEFAHDIYAGLGRKTGKYINPKYFYDKIGSHLFEEICLQPEYYLTRVETSIIYNYCNNILDRVYHNSNNDNISILELGSGSSTKTRVILKHLLARQNDLLYYFPIDVSKNMLYDSTLVLSKDFPHLVPIAIPDDYIAGTVKAGKYIESFNYIPDKKLILFLGSSIGNFEPDDAQSFLGDLRDKMKPSDSLLVGFDLDKEPDILNAAYNDKNGVTSKFNLNILDRINRELGGEFNLNSFSHYSFYNKEEQRIEMHLVSSLDQQVFVKDLGENFTFRKGEMIHTENSYKYVQSYINRLASSCGFEVIDHFLDEMSWFDLVLLRPV